MKLITLNTWGARLFDPLMQFLNAYKNDTDIFCFQEVYDTSSNNVFTRTNRKHYMYEEGKMTNAHKARANGYTEFVNGLSEFEGFYKSSQDRTDFHGPVDYDLHFGLAVFIKKGIEVIDQDDVFVHKSLNAARDGNHSTMGRNVQWVKMKKNGKVYTVCNFHGFWTRSGKADTPERIEQSKNIRSFLNTIDGPKILCGDFNLLPDTESIAILANGMRNLIKEYKVTTTRNKYYAKPDKFADYIFVSKEISVKDFVVLQNDVSDHLPLYLEFN